MRGGPKTSIAVVAALLLAIGLGACGGGDDSTSTGTEASAPAQTDGGASSAGGAANGDAEGKSGSGGGEGKSGGSAKSESSGQGSGGASGGGSGSFVPKHHDDSGGGAQKYKVKGGDNSVQEFGAEADTSELDAAATALHNFLDARAAGDYAAACEYLAKSVTEGLEKLAAQAKQIKDSSCAGLLEALTNPAAKQSMQDEAAQADVRSLRIEGEQGFVIYTGVGGTVLAMPMANEGGVWKVGTLAGTPLS